LLAIGLIARTAVAAETGTITGIIREAGDVASITAIDRATDKTYPGKLDAAAGTFKIEGLPLGGRFDCLIDFRDGARLEGINLNVPRSDYEEEQPLAAEDVATIADQVRALNKFEDQVDVLTIAGNIQHAAVLINKVRTRPFVNSKPGEIVWRAELWHFERPEETWVKSQDELFLVLYRQRIPKQDYAKKSITFDPALGGLAVTAERATVDLGPVRRPEPGPGVRLRNNPAKIESPKAK
jgi:hypothetical protein